MVNFYIDRINRGLMKVEDVPKLWRKKVGETMKPGNMKLAE